MFPFNNSWFLWLFRACASFFQNLAHILTKSYEENPVCRRVEHLKNVIFDDGLRGARVPHLSQTFGESEGPPSGTLVGGVFFETSKFAVSSCNFCTLTELAPLAHDTNFLTRFLLCCTIPTFVHARLLKLQNSWCDLDAILMRSWCDLDAILMRSWCDVMAWKTSFWRCIRS